MSYGSASLENDIRSRALAVADVLVSSTNNDRYADVKKHFQEQVSAARLPPDELTWFAIQRVAARVGQPAIRLQQEGTPIPAGALVFISPKMAVPNTVNDPTMRALRAASFVSAPAEWGDVLRQARLAAFCVDEPEQNEPTVSPASRTPRP